MILEEITFCPSINPEQPVMVLILFLAYQLRCAICALPDFIRTTELTGFNKNPGPHFV